MPHKCGIGRTGPQSNNEGRARTETAGWRWTRSQRSRTFARLLLEVALTGLRPLYQAIASEAVAMRAAGTRVNAIARHLGVDPGTVHKALRWLRQR